jgi:hypothetical protein
MKGTFLQTYRSKVPFAHEGEPRPGCPPLHEGAFLQTYRSKVPFAPDGGEPRR